MSQREIQAKINSLGTEVVSRVLARAALGDYDASKALLPYLIPKQTRMALPISERVAIDLSTTEKTKETLRNIATAIGEQRIGLDEGTALMDVVGRALERMSVADTQELMAKVEELETKQANPMAGGMGAARQAVSRANGFTPSGWGNFVKHPSIVSGDES
jgi:hypothetical protein